MKMVLAGRRTTIRLEPEFVEGLHLLARERGKTVKDLVGVIAAAQPSNLHQALRGTVMAGVMGRNSRYAKALDYHTGTNCRDIVFGVRHLFKANDRNGDVYLNDVRTDDREVRIALELPFWVALWEITKETQRNLAQIILEASGNGTNRNRHSDVRTFLMRHFLPGSQSFGK